METHFKKLNCRAGVFFAALLSLPLTGCISVSHYRAWNGPAEFEGRGGAFITKDGIDIYSSGEPFKCRILGVIDTSTMSSAQMMVLFGDSWSASKLVKEAKAHGGNAVVLTSDRLQVLGWVSSGTATAYQYGNTATAYGSSQTSANVSRERVAVLVKYVDTNYQSAPQNSPSILPATTKETDKKVETALIGRWAVVAHEGQTDGSWADKVEITFLPENRLAAESTQNGKVYPQRGRYSVKGPTLTIIDDQDSRPDALNFSLIENYLIINQFGQYGSDVVLRKTDGFNGQFTTSELQRLEADIRASAEKGDPQSQYNWVMLSALADLGWRRMKWKR